MTSQTPVHDYLAPRVADLVRDAVAQGFARETVIAVLTDLAGAALTDTPPVAPDADTPPLQDWDRSHPDVVLVNDTYAANVPTVGVHQEDDFIAPLTTRD